MWVDFSQFSSVIPVLGWPICAYLGYRTAIYSKRADIKRAAYEQVRSTVDSCWDRFRSCYETAYRQKDTSTSNDGKQVSTVGDYCKGIFSDLTADVARILHANSDVIGKAGMCRNLAIVSRFVQIASRVFDKVPDSVCLPQALDDEFQEQKRRIKRIA